MLNSDGVDPSGGKLYSRYERVRVEKIWKEYLGKEAGERFKNPPPKIFQMNLVNRTDAGELVKMRHSHNRLELIADKVQTQTPQQRGDRKGIDPNSYEIAMQRQCDLRPTEKWDLPLTQAQEIGWLISNPVKARTIRDMGRHRDYSHLRPDNQAATAQSDDATAAAAADSAGSPHPDGSPHHYIRKSRSTPTMPKTWPHIPAGPPHEQLAELNKRPSKWHKPRSFCPITKYADLYCASMHVNPFARVRGDA